MGWRTAGSRYECQISMTTRMPPCVSDRCRRSKSGLSRWTAKSTCGDSFNTLPRRISKIGTFTPRYNNRTERLPGFRCESGTYHAFLQACPRGAAGKDCRVDVASTNEELVGEFSIFFFLARPFPCSFTRFACARLLRAGIFMEQRQTI